MSIGTRIREARLMRQKTLEEVAQAAALKPSTISKYETGMVRNIPVINIMNISRFLDVSPYYILGMEEPDNGAILLSVAEQSLVEKFRRLTPADQKTIDLLAERLIEAEEERSSFEQLTL